MTGSRGGDGSDSIDGGSGADTLYGGDGTDLLVDGAGNDWLDFGAGDDFYSYLNTDSFGSETLVGGTGSNNLLLGSNWVADRSQGGFGTFSRGDGTTLFTQGWSILSVIEDNGSVSLVKNSGGLVFAKVGSGTPDDITLGGSQVSEISGPWRIVAAETIGGVNKVASRHDSGVLNIWRVDANWNYVASDAFVSGTSAEALALETSFQTDLNGDGVVGSSFTTIESGGSVSLVKNSGGLVFAKVGTGTPDDITLGGSQVSEISGPWRIVAAETIDGVNKVASRHDSGVLNIWRVDANWNYVASDAFVSGTSAEALALETSFQTDLNGDGVVGAPAAMPEEVKLLGTGDLLIT